MHEASGYAFSFKSSHPNVEYDKSVSVTHPLITIVTPCLNAGSTIRDNLASVAEVSKILASQEYCLEQWLVDGGSNDDTFDIYYDIRAETIDIHTFYQLHLERFVDSGIYEAMNRGLMKASGLYTHVLNADDFIIDARLYAQAVMKLYAGNRKILLSSIRYFRRTGSQWSGEWYISSVTASCSKWKDQLTNGLHYPHPGFMAETTLYQSIGFDTRYKLAADYKLMTILLLGCEVSTDIVFNEVPLVAMAKGGITGTIWGILKGIGEIKSINKELGNKGSLACRYLYKFLIRFKYTLLFTRLFKI